MNRISCRPAPSPSPWACRISCSRHPIGGLPLTPAAARLPEASAPFDQNVTNARPCLTNSLKGAALDPELIDHGDEVIVANTISLGTFKTYYYRNEASCRAGTQRMSAEAANIKAAADKKLDPYR